MSTLSHPDRTPLPDRTARRAYLADYQSDLITGVLGNLMGNGCRVQEVVTAGGESVITVTDPRIGTIVRVTIETIDTTMEEPA